MSSEYVAELELALREVDELTHAFKARFYESRNEVYGFVEGPDDIPYYREVIERLLPDGWSVVLFPARGKERLRRCFESWDSKIYDPSRICFYFDRDFSEILGDSVPKGQNVYVTPGYSIENSIFTKDVFVSFVRDNYRLQESDVPDSLEIITSFEKSVSDGTQALAPLIEYFLYHRQVGSEVQFSDLKLGHCLENERAAWKSETELLAVAVERCKADLPSAESLKEMRTILEAAGSPWLTFRGKQIVWIFLKALEDVHSHLCGVLCRRLKNRVQVSEDNCVAVFAPRFRGVDCLTAFVRGTYLEFVRQRAA